MPRRHSHTCLGLTLLFIAAANLSAQTANKSPNKISFEIAPVPSWVKRIEPPGNIETGSDGPSVVYLLADRQENLERHALFYHEVRKVTSGNGVKSSASIPVSFDPAFERLTFHSATVTRNGTASNRLDRSCIKLAQRETDPERSVYDAAWTAQLTLDDIRVGDIIDFAFTREGVSPLRRGKYTAMYFMQWEALILHNIVRVIYPASRNLQFKAENGAPSPKITTLNSLTEFWYEDHNVPGRTIEDDAPEAYDPRKRVDITEFHDWSEVTQWALAVFKSEPPHSPEFTATVAKLRSVVDPEQRVLAALQFVQDEIRYVKARAWLDAHAIATPDQVLRQRFANRIEKAVLLVALLEGSEIDAALALVSSSFGGTIRQLLPSIDLLDNAVVQVRLSGHAHWLNPAASGQRGPLSQLHVSRYSQALVLRPGTSELTPFEPPSGSFPVKKITENYRVPPPDKIPELEVISEYRGSAADRIRKFFRENKPEEIQKTYLEFYNRTFPDAKTQKPPWYEELPGENACRVTESYIVPRLWQLNDEKSRYNMYLQPLEMYSALGSTISPQRQDPFKLEYPNTVIEEVNVQMFEDWPLNAEAASINNEFFRLRDEPSSNGSTLQLRYSYEALKDRVDVADIEKFNEAIGKAKDSLGYSLRYQTQEQIKKAKSLTTFNWAIGASAFCFFATASYLAYVYFRQSKLPQQLPPPVDAPAGLNGIGGWLILLAIGQVLQPLRFAKPIWDVLSATMGTSSWRSLTDPIESSYNAWWAPTLLFELFLNIGAFVFAVLLVALFFTKKAAWRRAFALFLISLFLGAVLDTVLVDRIPSAAEPILTSVAELAPIVLTAAIWIPYVSFSKRVKATFRY
jgi:hypothetical protein